MNILFISFDADPPNMGGTATVVNVIAKYLVSKKHNVFLGYINQSVTPSIFFKEKIYINKKNKEQVELFFKRNKIDIVYNVLGHDIDWDFYKTIRGDVKEIVAYHCRPHISSWAAESIWNMFLSSRNPIGKIQKILWILFLPLTNVFHRQKERKKIINMYNNADKVMLLSYKYIPVFRKMIPQYNFETEKFVAIPNPIVFKDFFYISNYERKEKRVLVVSNITHAKRIELMLRIWQAIEKDTTFDDWSFDLVGDSAVLNKYKLMSRKLGLKRLTFYGKQNPLDYYRRSSIFLMTSRTEGWPMVLMESMQMGVIPIVYNSFEALEEIIEDGKTGFIIENNNEEQFIEKLKLLFNDGDLRKEMADNAIHSCAKYKIDIIGKKYEELFLSLCEQQTK